MDFFSKYHEHHLKVIDTLKKALYKKDNTIFDKLNFYDDAIFSEPLLFACINNTYEDWIDTLIFSLNKEKQVLNSIYTIAVDKKFIYLPSFGYIKLDNEYSKKIQIKYIENSIQILDEENNFLDYELQPLITNNEGIEFLICNHPLLKPLFIDEFGKKIDVLINYGLYKKHIGHFNSALKVIKLMYPKYYDLIKTYIKNVVFYKGNSNSFATIQAHGMVFFNVKDESNEIFFLDNIMHQCAHVFFNTLTFNKDKLFKISYKSDLSSFTGIIEDKGFELYDRYHGLFTQTNINLCLEKCLKMNLFTGENHNELLGRFTSNMKRFSFAITRFDKPNLYKEEGLRWFTFFKNTFLDLHNRNKNIIEKYDVSNQPYVFSYDIFKKTNKNLLD